MSSTKSLTTTGGYRGAPGPVDTAAVKPPNVVIHHGDGSTGQGRLRQLVTSIVSGEYYTLHDLPLGAPPVWLESAALLVVAGRLTGAVAGDVERFWRGGGAVLSLSSSQTLGCLSEEAESPAERDVLLSYGEEKDVPCRYSEVVRQLSTTGQSPQLSINPSSDLSTDQTHDATPMETSDITTACIVSTPVTVRHTTDSALPTCLPPAVIRCSPAGGSGVALLSQIDWDVSAPAQLRLLRALLRSELGVRCAAAAEEEVRYRPGYLMSDTVTAARLLEERPVRHSPALRVVAGAATTAAAGEAAGAGEEASADLLPLLLGPPPAAQFNYPLFQSELDTAQLGRCLVYLPAVTSSMDVLRESRLPHGAVVICDSQTRGRGRAGNTWLSPVGCCMVSIRLLVALDSLLGGRLSWLQHIAALAVVEAVDDPQFGLKWPNDMYWARQTKVGGVLVETDVTGRSAECRVGLGVNLDNAAPTVCLNQLLTAPVTREWLTARLLSRLERLLLLDAAELSRRYQQHWLHDQQQVTVQRDGAEVAAEVSGLDQHGFLVVRAASDGARLAVSPDGNSFDMMRGLIVPKQAI